MASSSSSTNTIAEAYANISIDDEEQSGLILEAAAVARVLNPALKWCLVGRFLTDKAINVTVMKNSLALFWRPVKGICIKDLGPNLFLFQFYHPFDMDWVIKQRPWSFEQHLLIVGKVEEGLQLASVPLFYFEIWVQVFDLPCGFMSEQVGKSIGDFIGKFVESDPNNFNGTWISYMRIRVLLHVRKPLKRRMKIKKEGGDWSWISFKYERITTFCLYCGILGHSKYFCENFMDQEDKEAPKPYGLFMKALNRRPQNNAEEKWLRYDSPMVETSGGTNAKNCMVVESIKPMVEAQIQELSGSENRLNFVSSPVIEVLNTLISARIEHGSSR
ncbi:hypothetical protein LguiA_033538 [Lonicera macranthoides]